MPDLANFIGGLLAFFLTLMVFSYLIGDNPLFRVAIYIFVGVSAGYVAVVAFWQVLVPDLFIPLFTGTPLQRVLLLVPLLLAGLMLMKGWPSLARLGTPAVGLLAGVGAAVALGGAVNGTILPQVGATIDAFAPGRFTSLEAPIDALIILGGVIVTLAYFHFSAGVTVDGSVRRFQAIDLLGYAGSVFIGITLGVVFAGVYSTALTALIERLHFLGTFFGLG
ncbi:MAG: hypothetical protein ACM3MF_00005 [Anaerolineae bacterium]